MGLQSKSGVGKVCWFNFSSHFKMAAVICFADIAEQINNLLQRQVFDWTVFKRSKAKTYNLAKPIFLLNIIRVYRCKICHW